MSSRPTSFPLSLPAATEKKIKVELYGYSPQINKAVGSANAGLMLAQLIYWSGKCANPDGWIYKTHKDFEKEILLTRQQQFDARSILKKLGVISEKLIGSPPILHYRYNSEVLDLLICGLYENNNNEENPNQETKTETPKNERTTKKKEPVNWVIQDELGVEIDCEKTANSFVDLFNEWYNGVGIAKAKPNIIRLMIIEDKVHADSLREVYRYLKQRGRSKGELKVEIESLTALRKKFIRICNEATRKEKEPEKKELQFKPKMWDGKV